MALFIGEYTSKIDSKGRMVFPAKFKSELALHPEKRLVVQKDFYQKCLSIYTLEAWNQLVDNMKSKLNLLNKEQAEFWRTFMSNRAEVTPDEVSGRIIVPRRLLDMIEVSDEVVFIGFDDRIELWSASKFQSELLSEEDFSNAAAKFLG